MAAPDSEVPVASLLGRTVAVVRGRRAIETLHNQRECFGQVRLGATVGQSEFADVVSAKSPAAEREVELRLMAEEEYLLASRGRLRLLEYETPAYDAAAHWEAVRARHPDPDKFDKLYEVYAHMRRKGYVVKCGLQFGTDYLLYRGSPDDFHAEYCCLVVDGEVEWRVIKTLARLAQDVRKRLVLCDIHEGEVIEIVIDDAFQRPPEANVSQKKRQRVQSIIDHARKRHKISNPRLE